MYTLLLALPLRENFLQLLLLCSASKEAEVATGGHYLCALSDLAVSLEQGK